MVQHEFSRLAIADRGEPAMRIIHAARELNHGRAHPSRLIALHTEAERDAAFVRRADEAVCLGPGLAGLDQALCAARADAAWIGSEPVAEPQEIAQRCQRLGIVFVGPDPVALRRMRAIAAEQEYAPVAPTNPFGRACRLTVPIVADGHGAVWPLGVSDHSCQRRGQTMLAESSSPTLPPDQEREIMNAAERLVLDAGCAGAGAVEFLYDLEARRFYFVRATTRLEHAATETVTGIDLVKLQLHVAMYFDEPVIAEARERVYTEVEKHIAALTSEPERPDAGELVGKIVDCPRPLAPRLTLAMSSASPAARHRLVEAMARRYYRTRSLTGFETGQLEGYDVVLARYVVDGVTRLLVTAYVELDDVAAIANAFARHAENVPAGELAVLDLYARYHDTAPLREETAARLRAALAEVPVPWAVHRIVVAAAEPGRGRGMSAIDLFTFRPHVGGLVEDEVLRGLHPMMGHRLRLRRLREFELERLSSPEDVYMFRGVARANAKDERLFALAEVRDLTAVRNERGGVVALPELERVLVSVLEAIRAFQARRPLHRRLMWNRVVLHAWPVIELHPDQIRALIERLAPRTAGPGLEMVAIQGRLRDDDGTVRDRMLRFFVPTSHDVAVEVSDPPTEPMQPLDEGTRRISSARRRGTLHPAEIVKLLAPGGRYSASGQPSGEFIELELSETGRLEPISRPPGTNRSGVVVGTIRNFTERYPEGMLRVILLGDPTCALGALAEPECRRIVAAIDLAEYLGVPLEWFALSAGAKIAMDSGTETMDWIAAGLRRIVLFTQAGGELNVVVAGINVGAQPYCNAEATMLMHTRGALIMTPQSTMVLAGKEALDYSGGVSAEDNFGIGGYERIMGPNGQAQYWAGDLADACRVLLRYYEHTYVAPGERFPRRAHTADPADRDVGEAPHHAPGSELKRIADVFSEEFNSDRKQPFDIRSVMSAVIDSDHRPLERWAAMRDAEVAVVWDAHLGGWPVSLIGIESRPLPRRGAIPQTDPSNGPPERCSRAPPRRSRARSMRRRAADQWSCSRTWPASMARPSPCASGSSSSEPRLRVR